MTVFVVQEPLRRNKDGELERVFDLSPALVYGQVEILLPKSFSSFSVSPMVASLIDKLRNFSDDDYLVPVGDPLAMAAAAMVAAKFNRGKVAILKWDRDTRQYIKAVIEI